MSNSAKCPFHHAAGGGTSNRDLWPNALPLRVLRQHSSLSDPMEPDFDYRWMYRLSALPQAYREDPEGWEMFVAQDTRVPIPHPVRYQLKTGSAGIFLKICTSPRFEAPPEERAASMLGIAREVADALEAC